MYKLHGFCQSGNTFKVAFLLRALEQPWQPIFVDFMNGVTRTDAWREQNNAMGEAPVLEVDGKLMTQSGAILTYLAEKHQKFGGKTADEKQEILRWILFDNHKLTSYFATYRFMKSFGATAPDQQVMAWLKLRLDNAFGVVDKHLAQHEFFVGDGPTIADMSISGYLFYPFEESDYALEGRFPNVVKWLARLKKVNGWADPYEILPGDRIAPRW
jgi:glutathione S-transferase